MLKLFPVPSLFGATPLAKQRAVPDVPDAERVAGAQQPPTPPQPFQGQASPRQIKRLIAKKKLGKTRYNQEDKEKAVGPKERRRKTAKNGPIKNEEIWSTPVPLPPPTTTTTTHPTL